MLEIARAMSFGTTAIPRNVRRPQRWRRAGRALSVPLSGVRADEHCVAYAIGVEHVSEQADVAEFLS
jgi:hypothetical protein